MVFALAELRKGHMDSVIVLIESIDFNPVRFCILSIKKYNNYKYIIYTGSIKKYTHYFRIYVLSPC